MRSRTVQLQCLCAQCCVSKTGSIGNTCKMAYKTIAGTSGIILPGNGSYKNITPTGAVFARPWAKKYIIVIAQGFYSTPVTNINTRRITAGSTSCRIANSYLGHP